ncbi:MAG: cytochrome c [Ignavibacteriales bacterium]|nr:cytochrome c [Ignavibacteriales bacterium]
MIAKGKELFDANCKSCHGDNGMGDGPAGLALNPKPRNFHAVDGWTNGRTIDAMYKTLQEGIIARGMAAYEYLPPADRFDIIHYIRTFAEFPPITEDELTSMNTSYNLTAGVVTASTMPVVKSENIILAESLNAVSKIQIAKQKLLQMSDDGGAKLLTKNSYSLEKVLWSFSSQSGISFDKYLAALSSSSLSMGYKPSVLQLSSSELKLIYDVLNSL